MEGKCDMAITKTSAWYEGWTQTNFIQCLLDDIQNNESWEEIDEIEVNLQKDYGDRPLVKGEGNIRI